MTKLYRRIAWNFIYTLEWIGEHWNWTPLRGDKSRGILISWLIMIIPTDNRVGFHPRKIPKNKAECFCLKFAKGESIISHFSLISWWYLVSHNHGVETHTQKETNIGDIPFPTSMILGGRINVVGFWKYVRKNHKATRKAHPLLFLHRHGTRKSVMPRWYCSSTMRFTSSSTFCFKACNENNKNAKKIQPQKIAKHFRCLKWRNPDLFSICMDTAYARENSPPK